MPDRPDLDPSNTEQVAMHDLMEVEACLRDLLQNTTDPAVLQRLYNLHREILRYLREFGPQSK